MVLKLEHVCINPDPPALGLENPLLWEEAWEPELLPNSQDSSAACMRTISVRETTELGVTERAIIPQIKKRIHVLFLCIIS